MDQTSVATMTAALVSGLFVTVQIFEMRKQTRLQREVAQAASQPYVWADIRKAGPTGWLMEFVVGNSGPTIATNVRVSISPPIDADDQHSHWVGPMHRKLATGLASLAPGRELCWPLGDSPDLVNDDAPLLTVVIDCDGPHGPIPTFEYVINLADIRETLGKHPGSLNQIAREIEKARQALVSSNRVQPIAIDDIVRPGSA